MKTIALGISLLLSIITPAVSQSPNNTADHVIEGGKIVVELLRALSGKKDEKNQGCKGTFADLCVKNDSRNSIAVELLHRHHQDKREMIILPGMQECSLQIGVGVWTYELRITATSQSIRKGDILIEGCQNMVMNIRY